VNRSAMAANARGARRLAGLVALCAMAGLAARATARPDAPADSMNARMAAERCDYGIALALRGELARAESAFVAMLGGDAAAHARAFNNLGNVNFLRGDVKLALAFYERAQRADSADAGVRLNRATALMMMGDEIGAQAAAAEGVRRAGGEAAAARLLGLKAEDAKPKAAEAAWLSRGEVRALLASTRTNRNALLANTLASVPAETTRANAAGAGKAAVGKPAPAAPAGAAKRPAATARLRSAGPRGAEGTDAASVLYWMR